jgi:hypothetical protein
MQSAYDGLSTEAPFLPFPDSVLPALIALRKTHQTMEDTKAYLATHAESVDQDRRLLEAEQSGLRDQEALSEGLQKRIQALRDGLDSQMEMGPEDVARERIQEMKQKKRSYDRETSKLLKSLRRFIDGQLATKLAAEDLGGPVVGDLMDIDGDDLAAGFNSQGRLKKARDNQDQDKRQRRIDEIWGNKEELAPEDGEDRDETTAAGTEMRELTEELLNALMESDGDNSDTYVQLGKESAAARFLVRSKVAQFHPKDSTKLRLVDFGRELDD